MSAASNALSALRQAGAAYQRHLNALAVQNKALDRHLDAWPQDWSDARSDACRRLTDMRAEEYDVTRMLRDLRDLIARTEALCVQLEEPV
jgi:capsid portal protein